MLFISNILQIVEFEKNIVNNTLLKKIAQKRATLADCPF
jgi:hypothetical protein